MIGDYLETKIRQFRQDKGITQQELADLVGVTRQTINALEKTLSFLEWQKWDHRLITVFWVPWNRDTEKRPIMGEIAWRYSDIAICTDDDPSTENRLSILNELSKPIQERFLAPWRTSYIIPERHYAIKFATEIAQPWDIVLLAWKWHEQVQLTNYWKRRWSDYLELKTIKGNS